MNTNTTNTINKNSKEKTLKILEAIYAGTHHCVPAELTDDPAYSEDGTCVVIPARANQASFIAVMDMNNENCIAELSYSDPICVFQGIRKEWKKNVLVAFKDICSGEFKPTGNESNLMLHAMGYPSKADVQLAMELAGV